MQNVKNLIVLFLGITFLACGSSSALTASNTPIANDVETETPALEETVSGDDLDEIQNFLRRKNQIVARCFEKATDAGEMGKTERGFLTLAMTISKNGTLKNLRITKTSVTSKTLNSCVLDKAQRWSILKLQADLDYSYRFGFEHL